MSRKLQGKIDGVIDLLPFVGQELLTWVKPTYPVTKSQGETTSTPKPSGFSKTTQKEMPDGIVMVSIPAGTFQMGSNDGGSDEKPLHKVTLSAFEMSACEISQGQYQVVARKNPSKFTGYDDLPVESITWLDAIKFCNVLSALAGLDKCYNEKTGECYFDKNGFRLPTEAEWEYACRAGTTTKYNTGDEESDLARAGWYKGNSGNKTHPVGQRTPNAWGLYDMHGNVREWCYDRYDRGYYKKSPATDPVREQSYSDSHVKRGGCWRDNADKCRSAYRYFFFAYPGKDTNVGFRVVRRVSPQNH